MARSHFAAYLLMAAAVGFLAGSLYERRHAPAPPSVPAAKPAAALPAPPKPPPSPEDRAQALIAAQKWPEAVAEIRAMIASGKPAWDDALALICRILNVEDPVEYVAREEALDPLAKEIEFHKYAVPLARATGSFASELYLELAFGWLSEAKEGKFILECMEDAGDDELPRVLHALEGNVTPDMLEPLAARARAAKGPGVQAVYLRAIVSAGPEAATVLRSLAGSTDRFLAEAASSCLQMIEPPVRGFLVLAPPGRGEDQDPKGKRMWAGPVRRGDIITKVGDVAIDSEKAWRDAVTRFTGRGQIEIALVRKGEEQRVSVPTLMGAPKGKFVEAAK